MRFSHTLAGVRWDIGNATIASFKCVHGWTELLRCNHKIVTRWFFFAIGIAAERLFDTYSMFDSVPIPSSIPTLILISVCMRAQSNQTTQNSSQYCSHVHGFVVQCRSKSKMRNLGAYNFYSNALGHTAAEMIFPNALLSHWSVQKREREKKMENRNWTGRRMPIAFALRVLRRILSSLINYTNYFVRVPHTRGSEHCGVSHLNQIIPNRRRMETKRRKKKNSMEWRRSACEHTDCVCVCLLLIRAQLSRIILCVYESSWTTELRNLNRPRREHVSNFHTVKSRDHIFRALISEKNDSRTAPPQPHTHHSDLID